MLSFLEVKPNWWLINSDFEYDISRIWTWFLSSIRFSNSPFWIPLGSSACCSFVRSYQTKYAKATGAVWVRYDTHHIWPPRATSFLAKSRKHPYPLKSLNSSIETIYTHNGENSSVAKKFSQRYYGRSKNSTWTLIPCPPSPIGTQLNGGRIGERKGI